MKNVKVTPHVFRHTFGTNAAAREVNVAIIKDIMGHSNVQTTLIYVHLQPSDMKVQHNRFSIINDIVQIKNN